ncbi:MAG: PAAR domain-containing protein [Polyangiaceae bacterium]|nr:PAAR domain-containing protein [Polyangiaceae bacterium]
MSIVETLKGAVDLAKDYPDTVKRAFEEYPDQIKSIPGEIKDEWETQTKPFVDAWKAADEALHDGKPFSADKVRRYAKAMKALFNLAKKENWLDPFLNRIFAKITAPIAALLPPRPAASLGSMYLGMPHAHKNAAGPSIGMVLVGPTPKVMINDLPAARAGDLGFAPTCGGLTPIFEVTCGSSKVFIGNYRAARMGDLCQVCVKASTPTAFQQGAASGAKGAGVVADGADAVAHAEEGEWDAAIAGALQTVEDAKKIAVQAVMGTDPALSPSFGAIITGSPVLAMTTAVINPILALISFASPVLIGGIPTPSSFVKFPGELGKLKSAGAASSEGPPANSGTEG